MRQLLFNPLGYVLAVALLLSACATTQIESVWKDPAYHSRPTKIMVIGVAKEPLNRRLYEDEFVAQLKSHGTDAIASYTVLPDLKQDDREEIAAQVKEMKADSILITRLVGKKLVRTYIPPTPYFPPPYYASWADYYAYGYRYMYTPGYVTQDEYATFETNLYEASSDKLIWAASSETWNSGADKARIKGFIDAMVKNMIEQGLLNK